ncbi:hypothetical protein NQ318_007526 [Aromia moschata]|uniref:PiggyBac transposable element-derived protein domain-containing protein n=1 Tax=Aromia moschata TaxID=1265417 RepID=A0AAV8YFU9_9CUCU|nr:hypothetical protein NQ318_007526 [Aromia moschata]
MPLTKPLLGKGYCLTMDNFCNTPHLADLLIQNKTDVYGTLLLRRKEVPKELANKIHVGERESHRNAMERQKDVCMISTVHNIETQEVATKSGPKIKPKAVIDYNHTMGGVDRVDQHLADYALPRKRGKKYYKKNILPFA